MGVPLRCRALGPWRNHWHHKVLQAAPVPGLSWSPLSAPWPGLCAALGPLDPMKPPPPPAAPADPVLLFIAAAWLVAEALAALAVVLTLAGLRSAWGRIMAVR